MSGPFAEGGPLPPISEERRRELEDELQRRMTEWDEFDKQVAPIEESARWPGREVD